MRLIIITRGGTLRFKLDSKLALKCNVLKIVNTPCMVAKRVRERKKERKRRVRENNLILALQQLSKQQSPSIIQKIWFI